MQLQIYQMLHQNYDNFHVFVACKGISEFNFNKYIKPQYKKYIDEGKLTIRYFPNKNQLSNFFDTIRDIDIEDFDYFCKIDDDDLYSPDYIKTYNDLANYYPNNNFFFRKDSQRLVRKNYKGFVSLEYDGSNIYMGPTLCMLKSVLKKIRKAEESVSNLQEYIKEEGLPEELYSCGFRYKFITIFLNGSATGSRTRICWLKASYSTIELSPNLEAALRIELRNAPLQKESCTIEASGPVDEDI